MASVPCFSSFLLVSFLLLFLVERLSGFLDKMLSVGVELGKARLPMSWLCRSNRADRRVRQDDETNCSSGKETHRRKLQPAPRGPAAHVSVRISKATRGARRPSSASGLAGDRGREAAREAVSQPASQCVARNFSRPHCSPSLASPGSVAVARSAWAACCVPAENVRCMSRSRTGCTERCTEAAELPRCKAVGSERASQLVAVWPTSSVGDRLVGAPVAFSFLV